MSIDRVRKKLGICKAIIQYVSVREKEILATDAHKDPGIFVDTGVERCITGKPRKRP